MNSEDGNNVKQVIEDLYNLNGESLQFINTCLENLKVIDILKQENNNPSSQISQIIQRQFSKIKDNAQFILKHLQVENFLLSQRVKDKSSESNMNDKVVDQKSQNEAKKELPKIQVIKKKQSKQ